jgi:hypothetical protein
MHPNKHRTDFGVRLTNEKQSLGPRRGRAPGRRRDGSAASQRSVIREAEGLIPKQIRGTSPPTVPEPTRAGRGSGGDDPAPVGRREMSRMARLGHDLARGIRDRDGAGGRPRIGPTLTLRHAGPHSRPSTLPIGQHRLDRPSQSVADDRRLLVARQPNSLWAIEPNTYYSLQSGAARFGRIDRRIEEPRCARRSDRPKRRRASLRASVLSDRSGRSTASVLVALTEWHSDS